MRNVSPKAPVPPPRIFRNLTLIAGVALVLLLCILFPRVLAFVELAARELRYFWWLILLTALGIYLFFFFGKKKD